MKKKNHSNEKLEAITFKTLIVGVDIAKHNQWARFVDCRGIEHNKALKFENNRNGFNAILTRTIIRETHIKNMYWKPHILTG